MPTGRMAGEDADAGGRRVTADAAASAGRVSMMPRLLRGVAIAIAIAAIIDPAAPWTSRTSPVVAVVAEDAADRALAGRIIDRLDRIFTVVDGPFTGAAATVLAGARPPAGSADLAAPAFVVLPEPAGPSVTLVEVSAPARSAPRSRVPVVATVRAQGARGRRVEVALRAGALDVDRAVREVVTDDERFDVPLTFVPTAVGAAPLRVTASLERDERVAHADIVVDVLDERWAVLFSDPRPTWMSTFVRRALDRDSRFMVTSRVITAPGVSADVGRPPALDVPVSLAHFDLVVAGAPEALGAREVAGLESFLRGRGGSVALLLDRRESGAYERLIGGVAWSAASEDTGLDVRPVMGDTASLRAGTVVWPDPMPAAATPVAMATRSQAAAGAGASAPASADRLPASGTGAVRSPASRTGAARSPASGTGATRLPASGTGAARPVVWRAPVGAGRLLVSGALDAWRFRDPATSSFDAFFRIMLAQAAAASPSAIEIDLGAAALALGDTTQLIVILRDAWLSDSDDAPIRASVSATLESAGRSTYVRLWPDGPRGRFRGVIRAPDAPGVSRVVVASGDDRASAPILVGEDVRAAVADAPDLLEMWANARAGALLPESRLDELPGMLAAALEPEPRRLVLHPMRSAWWIIPFALALGAEWLWRRRRGLA